MASLKENKPKTLDLQWSRFLYAALILLSLYFFFISKDPASAISNLGIALIFDPFDQNVIWTRRPIWQRAWLLVHVSIVIAGFGYLILK